MTSNVDQRVTKKSPTPRRHPPTVANFVKQIQCLDQTILSRVFKQNLSKTDSPGNRQVVTNAAQTPSSDDAVPVSTQCPRSTSYTSKHSVTNLVILVDGGHENHRRHVVKTVDPLPALVPLAADVINPAQQGGTPFAANATRATQNANLRIVAPSLHTHWAYTNGTLSMRYASSTMPDVRTRERRMSCSVAV